MALADAAFEDRVLERLGSREGPQRVRHCGTGLAQALGHLLLREIVGLHEELVGACRLDRVEIRPLEVLDQAAAETCSRHQAIAPPSAIGARLLSRAESSRAKSSYAFAALEWRS